MNHKLIYIRKIIRFKKTRKILSNIDDISVMEFQNSDVIGTIVSKILDVFREND